MCACVYAQSPLCLAEAHCAVAIDFEAECAEASSVEAQEYTLPDGGIIRITDECFRAPEVLFQPSLIGKEAPGISNLAYAAITKCEIDVRREMFGSMIVSGGTTQLPNFGHRLNTDLTKLVPASVKVCDLCVHASYPCQRRCFYGFVRI